MTNERVDSLARRELSTSEAQRQARQGQQLEQLARDTLKLSVSKDSKKKAKGK